MRALHEEAPASHPVTLPRVKFVNHKFKRTFRTEKVGLNAFMLQDVFDEVNFSSETASRTFSDDVKTEKINTVKMLAEPTEGKRFFEYKLKKESEPATRNGKILTLEVTIQPHSFGGRNC